MSGIEEAAWRVLAALEHRRDALNGDGHPGEDHDRWLAVGGHDVGAGVIVHDLVGDCSACGGAQYGAEDIEHAAWGDLRVALGLERYGWQAQSPAEDFAPYIERVAPLGNGTPVPEEATLPSGDARVAAL